MKWKILVGMALAIGLMSAVPAHAVIDLTYDDTLKDIQQTNNNPCVIGSPSCNNPAGFPFTSVPGGPGPQDQQNSVTGLDGKLGNADGFTYTVGQITTLMGSQTMNLLIDVNQACGDATGCPISLTKVDVLINGVVQMSLTPVPQTVPLSGSLQGNGYSDAGITGLNFSSFKSTDTVDFHIVWTNQTDGQESFFLAATNAQTCEQLGNCPVPEPSALILLGAGLVVVAVVAQRKFRRN
ncbi:MAG: PEP-CTERM sorting domain-containing protein [Alphaproteobacteria bacterium]